MTSRTFSSRIFLFLAVVVVVVVAVFDFKEGVDGGFLHFVADGRLLTLARLSRTSLLLLLLLLLLMRVFTLQLKDLRGRSSRSPSWTIEQTNK